MPMARAASTTRTVDVRDTRIGPGQQWRDAQQHQRDRGWNQPQPPQQDTEQQHTQGGQST